MKINFINITESEFLDSKILYKYMPLEFALGILKEKYLWLCNPVIWKDPFEKRFIESKYLINGKETEFPLKGKVFCLCMTQTATSEAHWNNYSNGQTGISFKYKRERLLEVLEKHTAGYDIYIGKVDYLRISELKKKLSQIELINAIQPFGLNNRQLQIQLLLLKRVAFRYEDEIRILAVKKHKTRESGIRLPYTLDSHKLIDTITIDPGVGTNTTGMLKKLFKEEYGFKKVYKSQLYTMRSDVRIEL